MADWYISAPKWSALSQWQASHAYTLGQIIRPLATPSIDSQNVYVCTTAGTSGTSEPSYNLNNNGTTSDGGVVWTNVTGQSAYAWAAPAGNFATLCANNDQPYRIGINDRVFVDHSSNSTEPGYALQGFGRPNVCYSVNAAGSVPPVAADYLPGATITYETSNYWNPCQGAFAFYGVNFVGGFASLFRIEDNLPKKWQDCTITFEGNAEIWAWDGSNAPVELRNVTITATQAYSYVLYPSATGRITWHNDEAVPALSGTILPSYLVNAGNQSTVPVVLRGLDLSGFTGTSILLANNQPYMPAQLVNCKLPSGDIATILGIPGGGGAGLSWFVDLVNCSNSGTLVDSHLDQNGYVYTDFANYLESGYTNAAGVSCSHKISSTGTTHINVVPGGPYILEGFDIFAITAGAGSPLTATVQCVSNTAGLTGDDVWLEVEYPGTAGTCLSTDKSSHAPLGAESLSAGTGTWSSPPGTPHYFSLQVSITPECAGIVRGVVKVQTGGIQVWYDPELQGVS